jgi:hypothetical protein
MRTMFEETPDFGDSKEHQQLEDTVARLCQSSDKDEVHAHRVAGRCLPCAGFFLKGGRGAQRIIECVRWLFARHTPKFYWGLKEERNVCRGALLVMRLRFVWIPTQRINNARAFPPQAEPGTTERTGLLRRTGTSRLHRTGTASSIRAGESLLGFTS